MSETRPAARAHILVSGRVQGVWFRDSTRERAQSLGVRGWVRNLSDGRVEAVAEGTWEQVDALVDYCRVGPRYARVDELELAWQDPTGDFGAFDVRY